MITSDVPKAVSAEVSQPVVLHTHKLHLQERGHLHLMTWVCLLLACVGTAWFSLQYFLLPQPKDFAPHWGTARWVQAADGNTPVAYFRNGFNLNTVPDGAFVTAAANQIFYLYVNGVFIGSNYVDFLHGDVTRAYIYDVPSVLLLGSNVIALRVVNMDNQLPSVRVNFGIIEAGSTYYFATGDGWQATAQSANVYPRYAQNPKDWTSIKLDASSWPPVSLAAAPPFSPVLAVNPLLYEQPVATHWISAGGSHDAYFISQIPLPAGATSAWLRIVATGSTMVFINGQLLIFWSPQPHNPQELVPDYFNGTTAIVQGRPGLEVGVYDISSYLHPGGNTLAVHVVTPRISDTAIGLDSLRAAMSIDMLISDSGNHSTWLSSDIDWHTSPHAVNGWTQGNSIALAWPRPVSNDRPGTPNLFPLANGNTPHSTSRGPTGTSTSKLFYLPNSNTPQSLQFPFSLVVQVILSALGTVLGLWLLMSLVVLRSYYRSANHALETLSTAFVPALACEVLLVALSREPHIARPFPYTAFWGLILIILIGVGYILLWLHTLAVQRQVTVWPQQKTPTRRQLAHLFARLPGKQLNPGTNTRLAHLFNYLGTWLRAHWALIPIVLLSIPLITYNLSYEPYWQDELTSFYAAKGVLAHGIPVLVSGFLYLKGELYSYVLALSMLILGDQGGAPRIVSVIEYLVSLPLFYGVGCYLFDRRISLLATAMLAISPYALLWGRQVRMYEQAQLLTILVIYMFYKALQQPQRALLVYLAVFCALVDYLSHEETFIILPAIVLCVLVFSRDAQHRIPIVLRQKHWWFAAAIGASVIGAQLLLVHFTHPPILGTDQTQRPLIQWTIDNIPFYVKLLFFPTALGAKPLPWITVNSLLAIAGCILAVYRGDQRAKYCALFLFVSFLILVFLFTLASDRYIYPLLPVYYLLGAYALLSALRALWAFVLLRQQPTGQTSTAAVLQGHSSRPIKLMGALTTGLLCASVLILPILPLSGYNLFISRAAGLPYRQHYPDYNVVAQYIHEHMQQGDIVIAVAPAISVLYYVGRVDYFFSIDRALYLFERDGRIIDTPTGSQAALLNQEDFQAVLATHARIWIVSDNAQHQSAVTKNNRFVFPPDFHLVYEGYQSAIFFRGS